jgi:hypothetical protein
MHNLREQDYGKTLSDIRAALQRSAAPTAVCRRPGPAAGDAVNEGLVGIVDGNGTRP